MWAQRRGRSRNERPKSREETPKVGSDTAVPLHCIWAYSVCCAMAGQPLQAAFNNSVTRQPLRKPVRNSTVDRTQVQGRPWCWLGVRWGRVHEDRW